jgi:antirestriction protein ArdC
LIKATGIDFRIGGNRAFYAPSEDYVQVPPPAAFFEPINWHRTALHELGHASGHASRLNRDLSGSFGSRKYAFEELVAEMNAAFCCATLGITPTTSDRGSRSCARTTAPLSVPHRSRAKPRISSWAFYPKPATRPPTDGGRHDPPHPGVARAPAR